ncbi:hypothetical protein BD408DRAFT_434128 [Parasitella parasitica]|nr:hypothetical protein BD408DRAFT_434128 [Parasitella parasitica]
MACLLHNKESSVALEIIRILKYYNPAQNHSINFNTNISKSHQLQYNEAILQVV